MVIIITWFFVSIIFGAVEAKLFHEYNGIDVRFKNKFKFDIHYLFTAIRLLVAVPIFLASEYPPLIFLFMTFSFPFLHDGAYYQLRWKLSQGEVYPKGWFDESRTTSAIISLGAWWRLMLFIIALGLIPVLI
jgi:hypothetical protein